MALNNSTQRPPKFPVPKVPPASEQLLTYVSGLGPQLAKKIIAYRSESGPFSAREDLKKVPRLGPKAFEQAAGFLRIRNGKNPLDSSAVYPESYSIVESMARNLGGLVKDLLADENMRQRINISEYVTDKVGMPTLHDILAELGKPGRDPRKQFEVFGFAQGVEKIEDLRPGMRLPGLVTNVTAFGAFVDVGVHQDGLVHVSELSERFVRDPRRVVRVNQQVTVTVLDVDMERNRISLSMKEKTDQAKKDGGKTSKPSDRRKEPQNRKKPKPSPLNNPFVDIFKKNRH